MLIFIICSDIKVANSLISSHCVLSYDFDITCTIPSMPIVVNSPLFLFMFLKMLFIYLLTTLRSLNSISISSLLLLYLSIQLLILLERFLLSLLNLSMVIVGSIHLALVYLDIPDISCFMDAAYRRLLFLSAFIIDESASDCRDSRRMVARWGGGYGGDAGGRGVNR